MPQSVTRYRNTIGAHVNWEDKQQNDQKKQNERIQQLAAQPGRHVGNINRQKVACAVVQLLSVITSVRNTNTRPSITSKRADELSVNERIQYADVSYRRKAIEQAFNREVKRGSEQNSHHENYPKIQAGVFEQRRVYSQRADSTTHQPRSDLIRPADSPLSKTHSVSLPENEITPSASGKIGYFNTMLASLADGLHEIDQFISRHDPLTLPTADASPIRHNKNDNMLKDIRKIRHSPRNPLNHFTKRANIKITEMLKKEELLNKGKIHKEELLSAVAVYLFNGSDGISLHINKVEELARNILDSNGLWGGNKDDKISTIQSESIIREWVFRNVLGVPPVEYIVNNMNSDAFPNYYTVSSIHHLLSFARLLKNNYLHYDRIPSSRWGDLNAMWHSFLTAEMPFLKFSDQSVTMLGLRDYNFANMYSGSRFLEMNSFKTYSPDEAISIGEKMWDIAAEEGVTIDNLAFYKAPALFLTHDSFTENKTHRNDNYIDAINNYIQYRKEIKEVQKDITEKYNNYLSATGAWLSKGKLADKIISRCPSLPPGFPDRADSIRTLGQKREKAERVAKQIYLNGMGKPCEDAPGSLNDEYQKLTADTAHSFREIDKYLILSAISSLPGGERQFIQSAGKRIYPANAYIQMMMGRGGAFVGTPKKHYLERTDLFAVKQNGEERIYALKAGRNNDDGYKLIRVDRDIKRYISSGIFGKSFDDYKITWDKVEDSEDIHGFDVNTNETPWSGSGDHISVITDSISKKHRDDLYNALYEAGNDKSDIQKAWNVIKHFIPFYDCVEGIVNNDLEHAVPACLLDAVAFVPVFGNAASLSGKFGMGVARGLRRGAHMVGGEGIQAAGKALLREVSLPTTTELASLGKNALRAIDPGFELIIATSSKFGKQIVNLLSTDKKTTALARHITASRALDKLPRASSDKYVMGILPGTELQVPLRNIGKQGVRNIYVLANKETGELFGRRYFKEASGELFPQITFGHFYNRVNGIQQWDSFNFNKLEDKNIPHESGLYTTLDLHGKATGKLFLKLKKGSLSITETSKGKYYMMEGKDNRVIIGKTSISNEFKVIDNNKKLEELKYLDSTWCPPRRFGRSLLVNPEVTCIELPQLGSEKITYRTNVVLNGYDKAHDFDVQYYGLYGMDTPTRLNIKNKIDDTLFYENGNTHLKQEDIDASVYEKVFADTDIHVSKNELKFSDSSDTYIFPSQALTKNEKLAVRRWTAVDDDLDDIFSDGMKDTTKMGMDSMNYDLNKKLATAEKLDEDERNMVRIFDSALNKIPSQRGDFIRVSEYTDSVIPWGSELKPGDIVTNYPCYMSVSSDMTYINQATEANSEVQTNVYLRFENTYSSKPLLKGSASLADELESVFKRDSAFEVKQIAIADDVTSGNHALEIKKRIVITLNEVELPPSKNAKNIHTGKTVNVQI
ncbi:hypothetical protein H0I54_10735 [Yersinia kristensenii]|uniref:hypothetical protein n=1 Tax=Yersinia kristensenii TaxID=28152 RepID=UPI001C6081C0|nr:hypothetical protein [Yersinia kristensenii]MBW5817973.1 hypothetical protein [Yersinia kristensenii]MBW5842289.1 hypothetical protein [Yersinia kristensenii]